MEVPRLGVKLELELELQLRAYAITPPDVNLVYDLRCSLQQPTE